MLAVTDTIMIDESELNEEFVHASGPGGQNVNKVATAVQLRFDVGRSPSLPPEVRARLLHLAGKRVNQDGILLIEARRLRTQEQNRQDARERLFQLIRQAAVPPKVRRKTRPTRAAKLRRLETKRKKSESKKTRAPVRGWND